MKQARTGEGKRDEQHNNDDPTLRALVSQSRPVSLPLDMDLVTLGVCTDLIRPRAAVLGDTWIPTRSLSHCRQAGKSRQSLPASHKLARHGFHVFPQGVSTRCSPPNLISTMLVLDNSPWLTSTRTRTEKKEADAPVVGL